jgi:ATP-dependent DNA helicase RecQ
MLDEASLEQKIQDVLQNRFHLTSLYPYQELVIHTICERNGLLGREIQQNAYEKQVVILPTGSGKSVCFMLPSLLIRGITIVVYPLLSLMNDQSRRFAELGEKAVILRGGQGRAERNALWHALATGSSRFIITNPETLQNTQVISHLSHLSISLMVIDEVHTVTQWGETFRPAYLVLSDIIRKISPQQVLAFTATASPRIIERITAILFDGKEPHVIRGNPDRPNIFYRALPTLCKKHAIEMLLRYSIALPALCFCMSRNRCEQYAWEMKMRIPSLQVRYYHAGLDKTEREATEQWFFSAEHAVLFCTTAYGMGVDKRGIRTVVHVDLSQDVESFLQESGRAGRDGKRSLSIVLLDYLSSETPRLQSSTPQEQLQAVFLQSDHCRREALLQMMGFAHDSCSGCDICNGTSVTVPDGLEQILALCSIYPFRFTVEMAAYTLCGDTSYSPRSSQHRFNPFFGVLYRWEPDDIIAAIHQLIRLHKLGRGTWLLGKNRLYCRKIKPLHERLSSLLSRDESVRPLR